MGDRANIIVKQGGERPPVFLYSHWGGYRMPETLQVALAKGWRWNDNAYLTRIIFDTMTAGDHDQETGYGISTGIEDNEHPYLEVDPGERMVRVLDKPWDDPGNGPRRVLCEYTFEAYVALGDEATWETLLADEED